MIDSANPPKYVRQPATGRIYIYNEKLVEDHPDMEAFNGEITPVASPVVIEPTIEKPAEEPVVDEATKLQEENAALLAKIASMEAATPVEVPDAPDDMDGEDRIAKIRAAIATIPVENYGQPYAGKPAMPKVADVSAAAGFKVYADEIGLAMA